MKKEGKAWEIVRSIVEKTDGPFVRSLLKYREKNHKPGLPKKISSERTKKIDERILLIKMCENLENKMINRLIEKFDGGYTGWDDQTQVSLNDLFERLEYKISIAKNVEKISEETKERNLTRLVDASNYIAMIIRHMENE